MKQLAFGDAVFLMLLRMSLCTTCLLDCYRSCYYIGSHFYLQNIHNFWLRSMFQCCWQEM